MVVVSIMPCTAKNLRRAVKRCPTAGCRMYYVLTTRELGKMIKQAGIDFVNLPEGQMDAPLGISTGAADIFANTGGVMEPHSELPMKLLPENPYPLPIYMSLRYRV